MLHFLLLYHPWCERGTDRETLACVLVEIKNPSKQLNVYHNLTLNVKIKGTNNSLEIKEVIHPETDCRVYVVAVWASLSFNRCFSTLQKQLNISNIGS